ncbi:hypothetical protein CWI38_1947p0010 [Hamiltosporidium tvaerminnensis]|uniref:Uncharacterized protein n=1 Tax=Hamiltosporidium tvaerminnensis TaxID=1176355 RepID=A0A4Q9LP53_9MICR|nr:hypothetical protein CWI38_1947p0010 [Hamiltosporidium tvaerminnensis]
MLLQLLAFWKKDKNTNKMHFSPIKNLLKAKYRLKEELLSVCDSSRWLKKEKIWPSLSTDGIYQHYNKSVPKNSVEAISFDRLRRLDSRRNVEEREKHVEPTPFTTANYQARWLEPKISINEEFMIEENIEKCENCSEFITNIDHMEEIKVGPCEEELGRISKRLIKKMCY